jgi:hypothetical protein
MGDITFSTYLIYTALMLAMVLPFWGFNKFETQKLDKRYWITAGILIGVYSLVIGLRYNVGKDYPAYLAWFKQYQTVGYYPVENSDFGFVWLNKALILAHAHFSFLFITIAFLQIFFMFKSLNYFKFLTSWYIFFFFTLIIMFNSMNLMRQTISYFIFFYTILLFLDKKYLWMFLYLFLAVSIHKSILLFVWVYPFLKYDLYKNRWVQLGVLFSAFVIGSHFLEAFSSSVSRITDMMGYQDYTSKVDKLTKVSKSFEGGSGLAKYIFLVLDVFIIVNGNKLKQRFSNYYVVPFYNLYFTGAVMESLVSSNYIFLRAIYFLLDFRILILSFLCFNYTEEKKPLSYVSLFVILLLSLAFFYNSIDTSVANCAPFNFVFE